MLEFTLGLLSLVAILSKALLFIRWMNLDRDGQDENPRAPKSAGIGRQGPREHSGRGSLRPELRGRFEPRLKTSCGGS